jgi:hypothetical protein
MTVEEFCIGRLVDFFFHHDLHKQVQRGRLDCGYANAKCQGVPDGDLGKVLPPHAHAEYVTERCNVRCPKPSWIPGLRS